MSGTNEVTENNLHSAKTIQDVHESVTCPNGHSHEWLTIWGGSRADYICHHSECKKMFHSDGRWY